MIKSIRLCFRHQRRVLARKSFIFDPGFNALVGPNGSGKSSLLKAIYQCRDCARQENTSVRYHYFNGEIMNPHKAYKYFKGLPGSVIRSRALFSSHGETMRDVLGSYRPEKGDCFLLDEPEVGHDLSWALKIRKGLDGLVRAGCQVIVVSHHPIFWAKANVVELQKGYLKRSCKLMYQAVANNCQGKAKN